MIPMDQENQSGAFTETDITFVPVPENEIAEVRRHTEPDQAAPSYVYSRPRPMQVPYSEPRIIPAEHSSARYVPGISPGAFYSQPSAFIRESAPPPPKRKSHAGAYAALIACLCVVCITLGAAAGILGARYENKYGSSVSGNYTIIHADAQDSPLKNVSAGDPAIDEIVRELLEKQKETGSAAALPSELIYLMSCDQVVAITTNVEYTSRFSGKSVDTYSGTGFIITENGYIVTNYHVISEGLAAGSDIIVSLYNNESYAAECKGYDEDNDVAVLKISATGLSPVTIGDSGAIKVGERVYAIGNPRQLLFTMTEGIISAVGRNVDIEDQGVISMFQIDAAVNPGNSGGPVYNSRGEVVGIVSAKYMDSGIEGLGFAIPILDAMRIADDIIEYGYVKGKPMLGVKGQTVDATQALYYGMVRGYYVSSVDPGSAADKAGVKVKDTIVELGGYEVTSIETLLSAKKNFTAGSTTTMKVYRQYSDSGEYLTLDITFDEYSVS